MNRVPEVKDGFILVPVESRDAIANALRLLNEIQHPLGLSDTPEYREVEFLAYCFEQAR